MKNCDRGLENAAQGRRPRAAFSRPKIFFAKIFFQGQKFFLRTKNCFNFCKHKDKISRKRYRGPWADIGESCPR